MMGYLDNVVVYLANVELGKNNNWLRFQAQIPRLGRSSNYSFEFCGTELQHCLSLTVEDIECLKEMLCSDYGYPPYDIKRAKEVLGQRKEYTIIRRSHKAKDDQD